MDITLTAAEPFVGAGRLSRQELGQVLRSNILQDIHQADSQRHFDNCAMAEGAAYVGQQWNSIEAAANRRSDAALEALGRLLHTVQDFYAHSNWIEIQLAAAPPADPIPVWDLRVESLPPGVVSGVWAIGVPKRCGSVAPSHDDLNKDSPTSSEGKRLVPSGPHQGQSLFQLAREAAVRASREQLARYFGGQPEGGIEPSTAVAGLAQEVLVSALKGLMARAAVAARSEVVSRPPRQPEQPS